MFDLERALAGEEVVDSQGNDIDEIFVLRNTDSIVAISNHGRVKVYKSNGICYENSTCRLSLKNEISKKELDIKQDKQDQYVIVRTYSAGVFAGYLISRDGKEVVLRDARRLFMWSGASSLSELAMKGVSRPDNCKFPCEVKKIILTEAIEILNVTEEAKKSIGDVPVWTQH